MERAPKISVLIPVYNTGEEHLREAVDSVLAQTFADFELIIVNDASTDPAVERVVLSYNDPRIRYHVNPANLGISGTRNRLIELARGEYLAVMDHDDISLPQRFEKEAAYLDAHPDVGVISCSIEVVEPGKRFVRDYPKTDSAIKLTLVTEFVLSHSASMIRKSVLEKSGVRYEERFSPAEDYALWCRLIPHTNFHSLPEVLFRYRVHEASTSAVQKEKMDRAAAAVRAMVRTENPALYEEFAASVRHITTVKLFGFVPFLTIVKHGRRTRCSVFGIPLFRSKIRHDPEGGSA